MIYAYLIWQKSTPDVILQVLVIYNDFLLRESISSGHISLIPLNLFLNDHKAHVYSTDDLFSFYVLSNFSPHQRISNCVWLNMIF